MPTRLASARFRVFSILRNHHAIQGYLNGHRAYRNSVRFADLNVHVRASRLVLCRHRWSASKRIRIGVYGVVVPPGETKARRFRLPLGKHKADCAALVVVPTSFFAIFITSVGSFAGTMAAILAIPLAYFLPLLYRQVVTIGVDGVHIRRLGAHRFVAFRDIEEICRNLEYGLAVELKLYNGTTVPLTTVEHNRNF